MNNTHVNRQPWLPTQLQHNVDLRGLLITTGCLLLLLTLLVPATARAALTAEVDRSTVNEGETFTLTLTVSGNNDSQPDLSGLNKDFDVISTGQNSSIQIINGNIQSHHDWSITLSPRHAGQLIIPPIAVGNDSSNALAITVLPATASSNGSGHLGDVFIEVSTKPEKVYVQQQLLYTVRLYYAAPLRQGSLDTPTLDNAIVQKLGDDSHFDTQRGGRLYHVIERRYAIFPQHSGTLTIPSLVFDGDVDDASARNVDSFFFNLNPPTRHVHLRSRTIAVQVASQPATYQGANWLPAQDIQLEEKWSTPHPQFRVGEPITRNLIIHAKGLTSSQLPDLPLPNLTGVKLYPDQAQTSDNAHGDTLESERIQKVAMIPTQAGELTLPAIQLHWWDTVTQHVRTAILSAETIHVLPAANTNADISNTPAQPAKTPIETKPAQTQSVTPTPGKTAIVSAAPQQTLSQIIWMALALFFALAWLITLLLWWRRKQPRPVAVKQPATVVPAEQEAVKHVKQGCQLNDPQRVKHALLLWAKTRWPATPPLSLGALATLIKDTSLANELVSLDKLLYAANVSGWQATLLLQCFNDYLKKTQNRDDTSHVSALAPLHLHKTRATAR